MDGNVEFEVYVTVDPKRRLYVCVVTDVATGDPIYTTPRREDRSEVRVMAKEWYARQGGR